MNERVSDTIDINVPHEPEDKPDLQPIDVLVLDDEPIIRTLCRRVLLRYEMNVRLSGTIEEALEQVRESVLDVIICDGNLDNGRTALDFIKQLNGNFNGEIIYISGGFKGNRELEELFVNNDYMQKPFRTSDLIQRIKEVVQHKKVVRRQST